MLRAFVLALLFYNIHKEDISNDSNIPENFPLTFQALFEWLKVNSANSNRELILSSFSKLSTEVSKKFLSVILYYYSQSYNSQELLLLDEGSSRKSSIYEPIVIGDIVTSGPDWW